jgi:hypothetical protein
VYTLKRCSGFDGERVLGLRIAVGRHAEQVLLPCAAIDAREREREAGARVVAVELRDLRIDPASGGCRPRPWSGRR